MPNIRPISDLRNSANEISDFCKQTREPVFITRNGTGDMVVQMCIRDRLRTEKRCTPSALSFRCV